MVLISEGFVTKVMITQLRVVITTPVTSCQWVSILKNGTSILLFTKKKTAIKNDTSIAVISLYGLIRLQNQRIINNKPVPAPICSNKLKASMASSSFKDNNAAKSIITKVEILPTNTLLLSDASLLTKRA